MKKKDIDKIDLLILSILQKNASITNKDLSDLIGLSPPPTLARVNALKAKGVITSFHVEVDYNYLKYKMNKFVILRIKEADLREASIHWFPVPWLSAYRITKRNKYTDDIMVYMHCLAPDEAKFDQAIEKLKSFPKLIELIIEDVLQFGNVENTMPIEAFK